MLWFIMWVSVILFSVNLVQFVMWGIRYLNVEILHRSGGYLLNFGKYGRYAVIFLVVTIICVFFLEKIKKRVYTIPSSTENYEIIKYVEKTSLLKGRFYGVTYKKDNGELIYLECPNSGSKVFLDENPYLSIMTTQRKRTPTKIEEYLTFYSTETTTFEITITKEMLF